MRKEKLINNGFYDDKYANYKKQLFSNNRKFAATRMKEPGRKGRNISQEPGTTKNHAKYDFRNHTISARARNQNPNISETRNNHLRDQKVRPPYQGGQVSLNHNQRLTHLADKHYLRNHIVTGNILSQEPTGLENQEICQETGSTGTNQLS